MQGFVRFALFVAVVALIGGGFYTKGLHATIDQQQAVISSLTTERDAARTRAELSGKDVVSKETALTEAQTKLADLQKQLDEAKAAPRRGRR